jgi:hypothetical protein
MVTRFLLVSGLAIGLLVAASPAEGQQYPPGTFFLSLSATTVTPGQTITATGRLSPGATTVSFSFFSEEQDVGDTTPDDDGNFTAALTIPSNATPGQHTIVATDNTGRSVSSGVTVVGAGAGGAGAGGAGAGGAGAGGAGAGVTGAGVTGAGVTGARATGTGTTGALPRTGDDVAVPLLRVGAVLLALGGLLIFVTRSRRESTVPS